MKKRIGISYTNTNPHYYWAWFTSDELLDDIELVELSFIENNVQDYATCDGFVLTGGVDIHPSFYNGLIEYDHRPEEFEIERDIFEKKMFEHAQANLLALLGFCRGLQLVNVLKGGKLVQDAGAHGNAVHKASGTDKEHKILVEKDTLLYNITGLTAGKVNSAHHQVIDPSAIGKNLKVNAWSSTEDGYIEGIEFDDKAKTAFMLCVQWHPERIKDSENPLSKNIKMHFLEAVRNTKSLA